MSKSAKTNNVTAAMYDTLVRPVITEKSMLSSEAGKVTFLVPLSASKEDVKAAVEAIFNVKVNKVNPIIKKHWLLLPMVKILMLQQEFRTWL